MQKYSLIYFITVLMLFASSCEEGIDTVERESTVYIPMNGLSEQSVLLGESIFELGIYKAGINQQAGNVTVVLKVDQDAFDTFRASNPGYQLLPESHYTILTPSVQIPKSKEREFCQIQLKGIDESFIGKKYILPISIESVSPEVDILDDRRTVLLSFSRYRNAYESVYKAFGKSSSADGSVQKIIDEQFPATTVSANTIKVKGVEVNMDLHLSVLGNNSVVISGAPGSEKFNITNTSGKNSTYEGVFDPSVQISRGKFMLFYSYLLDGVQMDAEVELRFWQ